MNRTTSAIKDMGMLFNESAGGIQVTGDSGTGKSCVMALFMQMLANKSDGPGFLLIDPHGDLCTDMEDSLANLPERLQRRVVIIHPADTARKIPGLNPLAVPADGLDELTWRARVIMRSSHVARILLHAWGERDFQSKPLLYKFTSWFLETLGLAGLTIPEVRHFFDPASPVYQPLTQLAPDAIARLELSMLAELRPRDREEFIASTKNRFLGLLKNPLIELALGKIDGGLDARQLIQDGAIVLVNCDSGSVLRDEDREILANIWLSEFIFAAYNTPRHLRKPFAIFVDELPLFQSSQHLIATNITQVRKFRLHFCCAHAGTQFFEDGVKNPLLNGLTSACKVHVIFRHQNKVDATYFADLMKLPEYSVTRVKHVQKVPTQFQDGHDLVTLTDTGESWSDADQSGGSEADGTTDSTTSSRGTNEGNNRTSAETFNDTGIRQATNEARAAVTGSSSSTGQSSGQTRTNTASWSKTSSRGGSRTFKQQLVPRIIVRDIVTSIQFYTPEETVMEGAAAIASSQTGTAFLYIAGSGTVKVSFPMPKKPFAMTPKFGRKKHARLWQLVTDRPEYALPQEIAAMRAAFTLELADRLTVLANNAALRNIPPLPALAVPVTGSLPFAPAIRADTPIVIQNHPLPI